MKNYKKTNDFTPISFNEAVELIKSGTHAIEKDCDDYDLMQSVLKYAFPRDKDSLKPFYEEMGFKYVRRSLSDKKEWIPCCGSETKYIKENYKVIKLSQIQPKDMKYTITKEQIQDLHQSQSIEVVREKLETLFSEVLPNEKTQAIDTIKELAEKFQIKLSEL